jgi:hypothetical protein
MSRQIRASFRNKVISLKEKTQGFMKLHEQNQEVCYLELSSIATDIRSIGKDIDSIEECDYSLPVVEKTINDLMPLLLEYELFASAQQMTLMFRNHVKDLKEMKGQLPYYQTGG